MTLSTQSHRDNACSTCFEVPKLDGTVIVHLAGSHGEPFTQSSGASGSNDHSGRFTISIRLCLGVPRGRTSQNYRHRFCNNFD
jgi:hypothetical protein